MKRALLILFFISSVVLSSQTSKRIDSNIAVNIGEGSVDYTTYTIYADAEAFIIDDSNIRSETQLMLQSRVEEETLKILYQTLSTVSFDGFRSVYQTLEDNSYLNRYVVDSLNNARLVSISYPTRKSIKVEMALELLQTNKIDIMGNFLQVADDYKNKAIVPYYNPQSDYDSLVIDARGLDFKPSLFPVIYNENGEPIHSITYVDKSNVAKNGFVRYSKTTKLDENKYSNMGKKPYNIVAWGVRGRLNGDIVIANDDASIILSAKKLKKALYDCKVVVIID